MRLKYNLAITVLLALICNSILAQDFQGKAYYLSKTTPDMSGWGNGQMTEFQKKQIAERMRGMFEKSYVLNFDRQASIFKEEEVLEAPGQKGFGGWWTSFSSGPQYKNIKTRQFIQDQEFFGRQFLITDTLQKFEWKMGTETKQIGQYLCMKATAIKKVDEFDWRSMRRKKSFEKNRDKSKADSRTHSYHFPEKMEDTQSAIYDVSIDPQQLKKIEDVEVKKRLNAELLRLIKENDAPTEALLQKKKALNK